MVQGLFLLHAAGSLVHLLCQNTCQSYEHTLGKERYKREFHREGKVYMATDHHLIPRWHRTQELKLCNTEALCTY